MSDLGTILYKAGEVGRIAGGYESSLRAQGDAIDDSIHHLGDDTGKLINEAYREHGAVGAADVIVAYLEALNKLRVQDQVPELTLQLAAKNLGFAIREQGITESEQDNVLQEIARR